MVSGEVGRWFWENIERKIGDGKGTFFWEDVWLGREPLKVRFPRLYHLSSNQEAKISDMRHWKEGEWR